MKKYIDAELEIVSMSNDIIATSITVKDEVGNGTVMDQGRRSIWN